MSEPGWKDAGSRTHCAHCGKLLNDEEYAVGHLTSVHDVALDDAKAAAGAVEWSEGDSDE